MGLGDSMVEILMGFGHGVLDDQQNVALSGIANRWFYRSVLYEVVVLDRMVIAEVYDAYLSE